MKTQTNHLWVTLVMMALLYAATTATTTASAQVHPLPPLSFDSLSQTYHGRLTTTLHRLFVRKDELRHYVTKDEAATHVTATALASELSRYITKDEAANHVTTTALNGELNRYVTKDEAANHVTTSDARLSDARTPKGTAGGDLSGSYPNPTIKSSVNLSGSPTATTPSSTDNSTRIATTAYVQANRYTHPTGNGYNHIPSGGSSGQILRYSSAGAAYWSNYPTCSDIGAASSSHSHSNATTSSAGFMSSSDKTALDNAMPKSGGTFTGNVRFQTGGASSGSKLNLGDGDYVYIHEDYDDHLNIYAAKGVNITSSQNGLCDNGSRVYSPLNPVPIATTSADGLMSYSDKAKLNNFCGKILYMAHVYINSEGQLTIIRQTSVSGFSLVYSLNADGTRLSVKYSTYRNYYPIITSSGGAAVLENCNMSGFDIIMINPNLSKPTCKMCRFNILIMEI